VATDRSGNDKTEVKLEFAHRWISAQKQVNAPVIKSEIKIISFLSLFIYSIRISLLSISIVTCSHDIDRLIDCNRRASGWDQYPLFYVISLIEIQNVIDLDLCS